MNAIDACLGVLPELCSCVSCKDSLKAARAELAQLREEARLGIILSKVIEWANETFPSLNPGSIAAHLLEEAQELVETGGTDRLEIADVVMIAAHLAHVQGFDLAGVIAGKFEMVKRREWGEPDADGVVEHIRDGGSGLGCGDKPIKGETKMKYRKKPIVIEAFQMTRERRASNVDWPEWLLKAWSEDRGKPGKLNPENFPNSDGTDRLVVCTLEGQMVVEWGDWIIKGIKGELYPCKPDIFEATYEPEFPSESPAPLSDLDNELALLRCRILELQEMLANARGDDVIRPVRCDTDRIEAAEVKR